MSTGAIWMMLLGMLLLYGGLAFCIGVAWYHGRHPMPEDALTPGDVPPELREDTPGGAG